tara:strand:+ start:502 stop:843 length:342 start_codon:yes stop_codon:yes gene_type:complete
MIKVIGGDEYEQCMVHGVVNWCINHFKLDGDIDISIELKMMEDCCGTCVDNDDGGYDIEISLNQSLRDIVATITHEMVHVNQYITEEWQGEGEREANKLQYELTDQIWKEDIL